MTPAEYPKCANCGLPFMQADANTNQVTCSPRCSRERHKHLERVRRGVEEPREAPRNERRCAGRGCKAKLSAYNRGTYCHACWSAMSVTRRDAILKRDPGAEPAHTYGRGARL